MTHAPDYTLYAVPIASFLLLFALEYVICAKTRRTLLRAAPFLAPLAAAVLAVCCLCATPHGFLDLRGLAAAIYAAYTAFCALSIGAARLAFYLRGRAMQRRSPEK